MPDQTTDDQALNAEFDALAKHAGLTVPEKCRPALLAGFKDLKRMKALLRQPRTAASEPAGTYDIRTVTRNI
jgi:hypothetical protein